MKKDEISRLLDRYLDARKENREVYFDAGEVDELLNHFEEEDNLSFYDDLLELGLKLHPGSTELLIRKGRQQIDEGLYQEAISLLLKIGDSSNPDIDVLLLECYASLGDYPKVVTLTEKLIDEKADSVDLAFEYIAPLLNDLGMIEEANDYVCRGLKLFPDNLTLKEELCFILESKGDYTKAAILCNELIDLNPYSFEYWFALGRAYSLSGNYDKAIDAFDFALTCDDSEVEVSLLKAYCLILNESYDKALEEFNDIMEANKEDTELVKRLFALKAECYLKMGDGEKVYELLHPYINGETPTSDPVIYTHYLHACVITGREQEAYTIIEKAALLFPENIRLQILYFFTFMEQKKEDEEYQQVLTQARERATKLVDTYENDDIPEFLYSKGLYLMMIDDIEHALLFLKKAYSLHPRMEFLNIFLSSVYTLMGNEEKSNYHLQQAPEEEKKLYLQMANAGLDSSFQIVNDVVNKTPRVSDLLADSFFRKKENKN